jgi:hypothetical protein
LQRQFTNTVSFVSPSRYFIRQGTLTKQCRSDNRPYEFFLFNDLLVYASKAVGNKYKLHRSIDINSAFVIQDLPDQKDKNELNRFQIVNSDKSFIVYANDLPAKQSWLKDLFNCISLVCSSSFFVFFISCSFFPCLAFLISVLSS